MNGLIGLAPLLLAAVLGACLACRAHYRRYGSGRASEKAFTCVCAVLLSVGSLAVYATVGRPLDWNRQAVDPSIDYQIAGKIAQLKRKVRENPDDAAAQIELAAAYFDGGRYADAADALDASLAISGPVAAVLGMKAQALYYRDGRTIQEQTRKALDRALEADPLEVQARMLLGQDAYFNGRYDEAIGHWRLLLDNHAAPGREGALKNAIEKAELKKGSERK